MGLGGHTIPTVARAARIRSASRHVRHSTSTSSSRSSAWSMSEPTATAPWRSRSTAPGQRFRRCDERLGHACRQFLAAGHAKGQVGQAGQEQGRLGQGRRIRDLAGQRQRHRGGQVGVDDRPDVGPCRVDRQVDREIRRRGETGWRACFVVRVIQADDDEVVGRELVLAPAAGRDQQPRGVESDGQVALAGRDEAARPESSPGPNDGLRRDPGLHRGIVRVVVAPRTIAP